MQRDGIVVAVAVWAIRYNTHTRPREIHFRQESDGFIYAYKKEGNCGVYDASYGTTVDAIGDGYMNQLRRNASTSWSVASVDSVVWHRETDTTTPVFFVSPALACPQCGYLSSHDCLAFGGAGEGEHKESQLYDIIHDASCDHSFDVAGGVVWKFMPMQFVIVLAWLREHDQRHSILLRRCAHCREKYTNLYGRVVEKAHHAGEYYGSRLDTSKADDAKGFLRSIGKQTRWIGDETQRKAAVRSIRRRLRRKMKGLSKSELQFFRMMAGAGAIKSMGGKNGSNYSKQDK